MNYVITLTHEDNIYEVTVKNRAIVNIVKYLGDSQTPSFPLFDDLQDNIKQLILQEIKDRECNDN